VTVPAETTVDLPLRGGGTVRHVLGEPHRLAPLERPPLTREVYAAAHVVVDGSGGIDWDATARFREHLWDLGLGVADAMDTAQRGQELSAPDARRLVQQTCSQARSRAGGAPLVVGVGTDDLDGSDDHGLAAITSTYLRQVHEARAAGALPVVMASRHLASVARRAADYRQVYDAVLAEAGGPVVLHWLGEAFDPSLGSYWTGSDEVRPDTVVLDLIRAHADVVHGIKVSLLDAQKEVALRAELPAGVRCFTGDDFHYTRLMAGDGHRHSDALLGAFAVVGPVASAALRLLDAGDDDAFVELLGSTEELSRIVFEAPTRFYKVGVAWVAHLAGHQDHFRMLGDLQAMRDPVHLARVLVAADALGLFPDPALAARRARAAFTERGVS
jgi:hypothetical protein